MADLNARIPATFLTQALDDDGDGIADADAFTNIRNAVQDEINGFLGGRFTVPFTNPVPAIVLDAARVFAAELLYKRRGVADKENPWHAQAKDLRDRLKKIAGGKMELDPDIQREKPSVSVLSEKAKTTNSAGNLSV